MNNQDQIFEKAYKNPDNIGIMKYVCNKFSKVLSREELDGCALRALWRCIKQHDDTKQKFTSSLYRFVTWECQVLLSTEQKNTKKFHPDNITCLTLENKSKDKDINNSSLFKSIKDGLLLIDEESRKLIEDYYMEQKTYKEIGVEIGCSTETVRKKIKKAISKLKDLCV